MEASKITKIMNKIEELPYQKILFDGKWGIGKTKHIMDSIEHKSNIYYISLFGKKDIDSFYEELYYLLVSNPKTYWYKIKRKIDKVNFSKLGFNISIPLISDIFMDIQKELGETQNITIVIDDIERKKEDFDIKEVFGFVDSITKNKTIKAVLVASSDNFTERTKTEFVEYSEKSLDRIYKITNYSTDAPENIVGEDVWPAVKNIYEEIEFQNLRTLEKASLFVEEVLNEIPDNSFNKKVTRSDIYKICFAVVIFTIDYENKIPQPTKEENRKNIKRYKEEEKTSDYIWHSILRRNLYTNMMHNFIPIFYEWYLTGEFQETTFRQTLELVNTYIETKHPLFMSDTEISSETTDFSVFVESMGTNISFVNFMKRLDELAVITEETNLHLNFSKEEVMNWLTSKYDFRDTDSMRLFDKILKQDSNFVKNIIPKLKIEVQSHIKDQIITSLKGNMKKTKFAQKDIDEIKILRLYFMNLDKADKLNLINDIQSNGWLLPLPNGEISDLHWTYCHSVFSTIQDIDRHIENSILEQFRKYCELKINESSDEIFKYRLRHLVKQYITGF